MMGERQEFLWTSLFMAFLLFLNFLCKNWHIYYCAWKLPGPLSLPFIGSLIVLLKAHNDFHSTLMQLCKRQKSVFKLFFQNDLYVVNSEPQDVEILLRNCLGKPFFYSFWDELVNDRITLPTAPVDVWKKKRKEFNRSFNPKVLETFNDVFVKNSKKLVEILSRKGGEVQTNVMFDIWKCNLDVFLETIADIDPELLEGRYELLEIVVRAEELINERGKKPWLMVDFFYRFSRVRKEIKSIAAETLRIGQQFLTLKKRQFSDDRTAAMLEDDLRMKRFSNHLVTMLNAQLISETDLQAETIIMAVAGSESSSVVATFVILILGIFPEIQEKIYEEISSVASATEDFTVDDVSRMEYLECVIKETLRLIPVAPIIMRKVDQDTKLNSYVQPAGSNVIIPITHIHRNPDLWLDPLNFNPDRFLEEKIEKKHRCAYIPFSFGPRNCIGLKFAMMGIRVNIAQIVKQFVIKTLGCNSIEDIAMEFKLIQHPKNYKIIFEERPKVT